MAIGNLLRNLRKSKRLSQTTLSRQSGVAQSALSEIENGERSPSWETIDKILRSTSSSFIVIPTRRSDACTAASHIAVAEARGDKHRAVREFIQLADNLAGEHDEVRFALAICEPAPTGTKHWDAAIAGLVAHRLEEEALPVPGWARDPARRLKKAWTFGEGEYTVPIPRDNVPQAFLDVNVLIDRDALASV
jgi:transcriptional regulator with XRE-family HTH domain